MQIVRPTFRAFEKRRGSRGSQKPSCFLGYTRPCLFPRLFEPRVRIVHRQAARVAPKSSLALLFECLLRVARSA